MNEPNSSNMLFGALVARADTPHRHAPQVNAAAHPARGIGRTAFAVAGATLLTLAWLLAQ